MGVTLPHPHQPLEGAVFVGNRRGIPLMDRLPADHRGRLCDNCQMAFGAPSRGKETRRKTMKVTLDRNDETAWIEDVSPKWALSIGYYFVYNYPNLKSWNIRAEAPPKSGECYTVFSPASGASEIARHINNPPKPPHHCETCTCNPECCK